MWPTLYVLRRSQPQTVFLIYGGRRPRQSSLRAANLSAEDRSQIRVRHGGTSRVFKIQSLRSENIDREHRADLILQSQPYAAARIYFTCRF